MAKVLLVDDVMGIRKSVAQILRTAGHEVTEAENGAVALQRMKDDSYAVVLTDILMPEKDGSEVIAWIKTLGRQPKIIAMSGGGGQATAEQALTMARNMADAVLQKPFARQDLLKTIDQLVA
jgi:CheY-like chemotaxis protein